MIYTIFLDIDGCVLKHHDGLTNIIKDYHKDFLTVREKGDLLPGVCEKFHEWSSKGYTIILTTGRPESMRGFTELQLEGHGLFWDHLIMGLKNGPRILINDKKSDMDLTALAYNLNRNEGLGSVKFREL